MAESIKRVTAAVSMPFMALKNGTGNSEIIANASQLACECSLRRLVIEYTTMLEHAPSTVDSISVAFTANSLLNTLCEIAVTYVHKNETPVVGFMPSNEKPFPKAMFRATRITIKESSMSHGDITSDRRGSLRMNVIFNAAILHAQAIGHFKLRAVFLILFIYSSVDSMILTVKCL